MTTRAKGTGLGLAIVEKNHGRSSRANYCWKIGKGAALACVWCSIEVRRRRKPDLLQWGRHPWRMTFWWSMTRRDIRSLICGILNDEGYDTRGAASSGEALAAIRARQPSLVILDIWLQGSELDGLEILKIVRRDTPNVPVLMISGHGTIETAVAAIKIGAYDFIEKPFKTDRLLLFVERAIEAARLKTRERRTSSACRRRRGIDRRHRPRYRSLRQTIDRVAPTGSRILISGPGRLGQGSRGAPRPQTLAAGRGSARGGEQRPAGARSVRDRVVRRRSECRRARHSAHHRALRTGAWRHAVSRRGRRHAARDAG